MKLQPFCGQTANRKITLKTITHTRYPRYWYRNAAANTALGITVK